MNCASDAAEAAARRGSWLFLIAGLLALAGNWLPGAPPHDKTAVAWLGVADLIVGAGLRLSCWRRWPARATLVVAPVAFFLIGRFNQAGALSSFSYATFFIVVFVWVGLSHPPRTSYLLAPIAAVFYVWPLRSPTLPADAARSVTVAVPVCVMVAETAARAVARLRHSMTELARVNAESAHRAGLLAAVAGAARAMSTLDAERVMAEVLDATEVLDLQLAWVAVFDDAAASFVLTHTRGLPAELTGRAYPVTMGVPGAVRAAGRTLVIHDYAAHPLAPPDAAEAGLRAMLAAPVRVGDDIVAVLCGAGLEAVAFAAEDIEAIELLAAQAGCALENARRFEAQRLETQRSEAAAHQDDLTGIGNRRHAQLLLDSLAAGDAVLLLDLDDFKAVNDTYGHAAGDQLLMRLGHYLRLHSRNGDNVARLGGDEFLVHFRATADHAVAAAQRLLDGWRQENPEVPATGGLAVHQPGRSPADTLQRADAALYAAKHRGRGRLEVDDQPDQQQPQRQSVISLLP